MPKGKEGVGGESDIEALIEVLKNSDHDNVHFFVRPDALILAINSRCKFLTNNSWPGLTPEEIHEEIRLYRELMLELVRKCLK